MQFSIIKIWNCTFAQIMNKISFNNFIERLKSSLQQPLPGEEAQFRLVPPSRGDYPEMDASSVRLGAVLALFYPGCNGVRLTFIRRSNSEGVHGGQIAFPGGAYEPTDHSMLNTALREAEEEIGINAAEVSVMGELSTLYIPPSNFLVYPFVGYLSQKPVFSPDFREVSEVFALDVNELLNENSVCEAKTNVRNSEITVPCFLIDGLVIWGATAMIVSELIEVIKRSYGDTMAL